MFYTSLFKAYFPCVAITNAIHVSRTFHFTGLPFIERVVDQMGIKLNAIESIWSCAARTCLAIVTELYSSFVEAYCSNYPLDQHC